MGFILATLALILFVVVYLLEGIVILFTDIKNKRWFKTNEKKKFTKAYKVDVLGNWLFKDFWDVIFSKGGYNFGRFGETLSSCFGKKRAERTLNWLGYIISIVIDVIDFTKWRKGGHCKASIQSDEQIDNFLNI